jgi:L-ascorbate metabolism protein UlaG (beta-lactamase superfamily)
MKIKWLGHACFLITSSNGTKIITDPYRVERGIHYAPIKEEADVVLVSHDHWDHNNISAVLGKPFVVDNSKNRVVKSIKIKGIDTFHDNVFGKERGPNRVYRFDIDNIRICHLGDLGHVLTQQQVEEIGQIDILLIPVGGSYTINATDASLVCERMQPKIVIPMHFKNSRCDFPIDDVSPFLKIMKKVKTTEYDEIEITSDKLPTSMEVMVLIPA